MSAGNKLPDWDNQPTNVKIYISGSSSIISATGLRTRRGPPGLAWCTVTRSPMYSATLWGPGPLWPTRSRSGLWREHDGSLGKLRQNWVRMMEHSPETKCFIINRWYVSRFLISMTKGQMFQFHIGNIFHFSDPNKNEDGLWVEVTSGTVWPAYTASNREFIWISANNYSIGSGMRSATK